MIQSWSSTSLNWHLVIFEQRISMYNVQSMKSVFTTKLSVLTKKEMVLKNKYLLYKTNCFFFFSVRLSLYSCIYVHVYMYGHVCVCVCSCISVHLYACMCVCVCGCLFPLSSLLLFSLNKKKEEIKAILLKIYSFEIKVFIVKVAFLFETLFSYSTKSID